MRTSIVSSGCSRPNEGGDGDGRHPSRAEGSRHQPSVLTATSRLKIEEGRFGRIRIRHLEDGPARRPLIGIGRNPRRRGRQTRGMIR
jgi:hypothetical protein